MNWEQSLKFWVPALCLGHRVGQDWVLANDFSIVEIEKLQRALLSSLGFRLCENY